MATRGSHNLSNWFESFNRFPAVACVSGLRLPGIRTTNRVKSAPSRSQTFKLLDSKLRSPAKAKVCPHKRQVGRGKARQARGPRPFNPPLKTGFHYSSHSHVY